MNTPTPSPSANRDDEYPDLSEEQWVEYSTFLQNLAGWLQRHTDASAVTAWSPQGNFKLAISVGTNGIHVWAGRGGTRADLWKVLDYARERCLAQKNLPVPMPEVEVVAEQKWSDW